MVFNKKLFSILKIKLFESENELPHEYIVSNPDIIDSLILLLDNNSIFERVNSGKAILRLIFVIL